MTKFETIKELVNVPQAAERYGLNVTHGNMCLCPFHGEKTPSMKLYEKNYHCFGCGAHGDVIALAANLFNIPMLEAAKRINADFSLGLDMEKPISSREIALIQCKSRKPKTLPSGKAMRGSRLRNISVSFVIGERNLHRNRKRKNPMNAFSKVCRSVTTLNTFAMFLSSAQRKNALRLERRWSELSKECVNTAEALSPVWRDKFGKLNEPLFCKAFISDYPLIFCNNRFTMQTARSARKLLLTKFTKSLYRM